MSAARITGTEKSSTSVSSRGQSSNTAANKHDAAARAACCACARGIFSSESTLIKFAMKATYCVFCSIFRVFSPFFARGPRSRSEEFEADASLELDALIVDAPAVQALRESAMPAQPHVVPIVQIAANILRCHQSVRPFTRLQQYLCRSRLSQVFSSKDILACERLWCPPSHAGLCQRHRN